jgi:hypothetical protein
MPGFDVWTREMADTWGSADGQIAEDDKNLPDWLPAELREFNVVRFSQSFLTAWRLCPRSAVAETRPTYGEAAAAGIVAHSIIDKRIEAGGAYPENDNAAIMDKVRELEVAGWEAPDMEAFVATAQGHAEVLTNLYIDKYHCYQPNVWTEESAVYIWDTRDTGTGHPHDPDFIIMTGSADLIFEHGGRRVGVDWKTGARMQEPWMVQRYGVQWRGYAVLFGLDEMHFEYPIALIKGDYVAKKYQGTVVVKADAAEREAYAAQLLDETLPVARALLRSTSYEDHAPMPTNWHCGKWCNVFMNHECMGQYTEVQWVAKAHLDAIGSGTQSVKLGKKEEHG